MASRPAQRHRGRVPSAHERKTGQLPQRVSKERRTSLKERETIWRVGAHFLHQQKASSLECQLEVWWHHLDLIEDQSNRAVRAPRLFHSWQLEVRDHYQRPEVWACRQSRLHTDQLPDGLASSRQICGQVWQDWSQHAQKRPKDGYNSNMARFRTSGQAMAQVLPQRSHHAR